MKTVLQLMHFIFSQVLESVDVWESLSAKQSGGRWEPANPSVFFFLLIFVLHSSKIQTQIFSIHSSIVYYFFFYCNFFTLNTHHTGFKIIKSTRYNIPEKEMLLSILVLFMKLTLTIFVGFQSFRSRMHRIRLKFLSEVSYKVTVTCVSNKLYNYGLFWGELALEGPANLCESFGAKTFCL